MAGIVDVVVVGAGHAGLAMSHCLSARGIEHVVLERGEVANSWRTERWDSLRLLTPNWLSRLPGVAYAGDDPEGYMSADEVIDFISRYAWKIAAPVRTGTTVEAVEHCGDGYLVLTDRGLWRCRAVVLASGAFNLPLLPPCAAAIPGAVTQIAAMHYRNPGQLEPGAVLVVGASATGLQLADEIRRAGHEVMLAVGEHVRLPRVYRGRDIQWWLHAAGVLDERYDEVEDLARARRLASPQLIGSRTRPIFDLNALSAMGVRLVGRLAGVRDGRALFSGSLRNVCALADLKMERLLRRLDAWVEDGGMVAPLAPAEHYASTALPASPPLSARFGEHGIRTVVWATGMRADYSWLKVPVLDAKGRIRHEGGVTPAPGVYVTGLPLLRRRKSSFIHGAEDDARELTAYLAAHLDALAARARRRALPAEHAPGAEHGRPATGPLDTTTQARSATSAHASGSGAPETASASAVRIV